MHTKNGSINFDVYLHVKNKLHSHANYIIVGMRNFYDIFENVNDHLSTDFPIFKTVPLRYYI